MKEVPEVSRLCKILARNPVSVLQTIRLPEENMAFGE